MTDDLKDFMRENYLQYASYVILERAIPNMDGFKPVQRRILHTLFELEDGKFHKVANVVGQTMAYHPHGDASINDALVHLASKGFLLDKQGNFGNLLTGDPAAAARYIETRLSPLAKETLFNKDITEFIPSYDGRKKEPVTLPAKLPMLLLHGAEGIAVGMSTKILPHNFNELIKAQIAILEEKSYKLLPDFPTGGIMDASEYEKGKGKVKIRAKVTTPNDKTIVVEEICPGTTTESVIASVDEAAKKGKIKIDSINDFTAEKVEIEIKLPRGQYADQVIEELYAFTNLEVSLSSQPTVIKDNLPWEATVNEILEYHLDQLQAYLKRELEIERDRLIEKIFIKTLEQIFIENRIYKQIEQEKSYEGVHKTVEKNLVPFHDQLERLPVYDDRERLLSIPIRRISKFDLEKNQEDIKALAKRLKEVKKDLRNLRGYTIRFLEELQQKYGQDFKRRTKVSEIEELDVKAISTRQLTVGIDPKTGYIGTKVRSEQSIECTNFDKILAFFSDGTFKVVNVPEKQVLPVKGASIVYAGIADKETVISVVYSEVKTGICYAKRFIVKQFILDKPYDFFTPGHKLEYLTTRENAVIELKYKPKARLKVKSQEFALNEITVKSYTAKGIRLSTKEVKKVKVCE